MIRLAILASLLISVPVYGDSSAIRESSTAMELKDPFRRPQLQEKVTGPLSDLERFSLGELRLVGIMTGPEKLRAMVLAPDGRTYFVAENMKIGTRKGIVRSISSDKVVVQEKIVNVLGEEENVRVELKLETQAALNQ